jgi:hypothetical protein
MILARIPRSWRTNTALKFAPDRLLDNLGSASRDN